MPIKTVGTVIDIPVGRKNLLVSKHSAICVTGGSLRRAKVACRPMLQYSDGQGE